MALRFAVPVTQLVNDDASAIASGWLLNFYDTGTTTRKDTFSDNALSTANANPVVADSSGRFGDIFLESGTYKVVLTDADAVEKWTADPVDGALGASGEVVAKTANYTVTVDDATKIIAMDASGGARTVNLLTAASAGDGFEITIKKTDSSVNTVTVDGDSAETIDGATTYVLNRQYEAVTIRSDATNWHSLSNKGESWVKGADIASAATLVLGTDGNYFDITGNTGPTTAITVSGGRFFMVQFDSTPTWNHGATLDLPGEANFTFAAGDRAMCFAQAANDVQVLNISKADGTPIVGAVTQATQAAIEGETNEDTYIPPDLFKHNPGVAKAWGKIDGTGVGIDASYNIASIDDDAVGAIGVNFTTAMSSANYACGAIPFSSANSSAHITAQVAGSFDVVAEDLAGTDTDPSDSHQVWAWGDQ